MARSLMLAEVPLSGAISTPLYYKRKVQKMKDLLKTWVSTENQFEDSRRKKEQKQYSRPVRKNPMENKDPHRYQSIMAVVNSKRENRKNLKRKRIKMKTVGTLQN